jgi:hypothetical protein
MNLLRLLEELRRELQYLDQAILSLERLQKTTGRHGRPPKLLSEVQRPARRRGNRKKAAGTAESE